MLENEARTLLSKWRDQRTPLHIIARFPGCSFALDCCVRRLTDDAVILDLPGVQDSCEFVIRDFSFIQLRAADVRAANDGNRQYASGLRCCGQRAEALTIMTMAQ
jgi:hypothetical protein